MFAIVKLGAKQFNVKPNDVILIDRVSNEVGSTLDTNQVLAKSTGSSIEVGKPFVEGASVKLEVLEHLRDKKIIVFKKKRRQNYRRKNGHRQLLTKVRVTEVL